jgi:hypothetical protein
VVVAYCEAIFQRFVGCTEGNCEESQESRFLGRGVLTSTLIFGNPSVNRFIQCSQMYVKKQPTSHLDYEHSCGLPSLCGIFCINRQCK